MKLVRYSDNGWLRQAYVFGDGQKPESGIPYNPPDLSTLDLSERQIKRLNNFLIEQELITYLDVLKASGGLSTLLKKLNLYQYRKQIIVLYKLEDKDA